ncbi:hypothetical protein EDD85DRAFT_942367 [Armillaria nabsnona]|nr:hypothetical protein EDD85DRAFT_942367 [Armillaria nabsnona]
MTVLTQITKSYSRWSESTRNTREFPEGTRLSIGSLDLGQALGITSPHQEARACKDQERRVGFCVTSLLAHLETEEQPHLNMKGESSHEPERVRQDVGPGWGGEGVGKSVIRVKTTFLKFLGSMDEPDHFNWLWPLVRGDLVVYTAAYCVVSPHVAFATDLYRLLRLRNGPAIRTSHRHHIVIVRVCTRAVRGPVGFGPY